jgi:hypothetical protein
MENDEDEEERRYRILKEEKPGRVIRPLEFHKRQRIHQGTMDSFLTPQSSTPRLSSPPNVTMTEASTNDSTYTPEWEFTQVDEEERQQPPPTRDPAKDIKTNYQKDPFTRTFFYKKIPAMNLTETQRKEITQLKIDHINKMINMSVLAKTIQVGPLRMSQIPDVVKAIHQMGYPIDVPTVMRQIDTNQHQRYVHSFDRKKPDRFILTLDLEKEVQFGTIPNIEPLILQIWRQFTMSVEAGAEKSYIKIQPCHPPQTTTYPLCTLYDIHNLI